jgi:Domain of unknown function (DUF4384)
MGRSLVASPEGIISAKKALEAHNLTHQLLAEQLQLGRTTINNFFNGIPVLRLNFVEICTHLDLDWEDIVEVGDKSLNTVWQKLLKLGNSTEKMGVVLAEEEKLRWTTEKPTPYKTSVRLGSYINFQIDLDTPGYLLLLQKDTSGEVWCFCPSCFAPEMQLDTGKTILPQEGSPIKAFQLEGKPGNEQILTFISKELPTFDWLPKGNDDAFQLTETHLRELIQYFDEKKGDCQVFYTNYKVVQ